MTHIMERKLGSGYCPKCHRVLEGPICVHCMKEGLKMVVKDIELINRDLEIASKISKKDNDETEK